MKVFVTGASGWIGKPVTKQLLAHGHEVLGLARNDASAKAITDLEATPHKGSLTDIESLKEAAKIADGVIHLAFVHDFSTMESFKAANETDRLAIEAIGSVLEGTGKPFVIASGVLGFPPGLVSTEDSEPLRGQMSDRFMAADMIYAMSKDKNVRGSVVRLCPTVHGTGDQGFMTILGGMAKKNGFAAYVGDGSARWPAVHVEDAAELFRLVVEKGKPAATYHAVAEEGFPMKQIMGVIGKRVGVPTESKTLEEAAGPLGFFASVISMDNPSSSEKTQAELGWKPTQIGLMEDLERNYFN